MSGAAPWRIVDQWCDGEYFDVVSGEGDDGITIATCTDRRHAEAIIEMLAALEELVELFEVDADKMRRGWIADAMRGPAALNHDQADAVVRHPFGQARSAVAKAREAE